MTISLVGLEEDGEEKEDESLLTHPGKEKERRSKSETIIFLFFILSSSSLY
jgi:hypothetical protein